MVESTEIDLPGNYVIQYLENGQLIWSRGRENGLPNGLMPAKYPDNDKLFQILAVLEEAMEQIKGHILLKFFIPFPQSEAPPA